MLRSGDPPADVAATAEIDPPALRADSVAFTARTLAEDLVEALGGRGLACRDIVVTLQTEHGESHERVWRLDGPLSSDRPRSPVALIAERVRWQVDGWLSGPIGARPTAGVSRVVLAPAAVEPARGRQLGFWGGEAGAGERVLRAVARLEGLVGADAVRVPETAGGREPADAVSLVKAAAVDLGSRRVVKLGTSPANVPGGGVAAPPWPGRLPAPSPSLVHERPQPAEVIDAVGQPIEVSARGELSATPVQVRIDKTHHRVVGWAGPWLLDERWWDADARRRSARLQVALSDGSAHLMARSQQRWWLIATYA